MQQRDIPGDLFVIGAGSLVGRLMRSAWLGSPARWCARAGPVDATWDLADGVDALARAVEGAGTLLCLAGATPGAADFSLNVSVGEAAVRAAELAGCGQVLLASSMGVYGSEGGPFAETAPCLPLGEYGRSKLAMEMATQNARGTHVTALRLGNIVGADMLFRNIAAGREIVIDQFADGSTPRRSYIDPVQLAQVIAGLVGRALPPILNVAAAPAQSMSDLATAAGLSWQSRPANENAVASVEMDLTLLAGLLDVPTASPETMVARWRQASEAQR